MGLDQGTVCRHIAAQMEAMEIDYADREGDFQACDVCTIVEIKGPEGAELWMRSSSSSLHSTLGMLGGGWLIAASDLADGPDSL